MDIDIFIDLVWRLHTLRPSGANGPRNGSRYEHEIANHLSHLNARVDGGSGHGNDIEFLLPDHSMCSLETKHNSDEFGGKTFRLVNERLELPDSVIKTFISEDYVPFGGRIPSFLRGDRTVATWENEKHLFKDEYLDLVNLNGPADYYISKGAHYIQVKGRGLYHTGEDILNLGVPFFRPNVVKIRIRAKRHHGKGVPPTSVQASFNVKLRDLERSDYDIETNIPPRLMA